MKNLKSSKRADFPKEFNLNPDGLRRWIIKQPRWIRINLKKKRNRKKFQKNQWKYISQWVKIQFMGFVLTLPIRRIIDYPGITSKFVTVTPWPEGEIYIFDK